MPGDWRDAKEPMGVKSQIKAMCTKGYTVGASSVVVVLWLALLLA